MKRWSGSSSWSNILFLGVRHWHQSIYSLAFLFLLFKSLSSGNHTTSKSIWSSDNSTKLVLLNVTVDVKRPKSISFFNGFSLMILITHRPHISNATLTWSCNILRARSFHIMIWHDIFTGTLKWSSQVWLDTIDIFCLHIVWARSHWSLACSVS